jgi:hypothetical protein
MMFTVLAVRQIPFNNNKLATIDTPDSLIVYRATLKNAASIQAGGFSQGF